MQEFAGHYSSQITMDIYTCVNVDANGCAPVSLEELKSWFAQVDEPACCVFSSRAIKERRMQIRGEAAIACGFMAGLATGLLFDGCFDGYIDRFRSFDFSRGKPQKTGPSRQEAAAPIEPRSVDTSRTEVIVTKNGKIYHRSSGCRSLSKNAIRTSVPLATALERGKTPCPTCCPPVG